MSSFRRYFKDPATDDGVKRSTRGGVIVLEKDGLPYYEDGKTLSESKYGALKPIYRDGQLCEISYVVVIYG